MILFTVALWVALLGGLHIGLQSVFKPTFVEIESQLMIQDLERVESAVDRETKLLSATAQDYTDAEGVESLLSAKADDDSFAIAPASLRPEVLRTLDLDTVIVFDAFGRSKHWLHDLSEDEIASNREFTPAGFAAAFPVIATARAGTASGTSRRGLVRFKSGKLVYAAAAQVLGAKDKALGTILMLRELDLEAKDQLAEQVHLPLTIKAAAPRGPALSASSAKPVVDAGVITASAWLKDPFGQSIAQYTVRRETSILDQGNHTLTLAGFGSLFMLSLVLIMLIVLLQWSVVRPLDHLTRSMDDIRKTGDLDLRLGINRQDEIGLLAYNFDRLLEILSERNRVLEELATTDGLTKLLNRRTAMERLGALMDANAKAHAEAPLAAREPLSVLLLDVDHFKRVNDTVGHSVGDRVLRQVASTLRLRLSGAEFAGRYGGEEFLVVLPGYDREAARVKAEVIRESIQDTPVQGLDWRVTVSTGVAVWTKQTEHGLLATADLNLYRAKETGRNRVVADDVPQAMLPAASIPPPGALS